jgi:GGDEF domain-containing protein
MAKVTRAGDVIARTGAAEFSVIAVDAGAHAAAELAEVYRNALRRVNAVSTEPAAASATVAFAVRGDDGETREELTSAAEAALQAMRAPDGDLSGRSSAIAV